VALGASQDRGVPVRVEDASLDIRLRSKADGAPIERCSPRATRLRSGMTRFTWTFP
jgi:hypothetical protein